MLSIPKEITIELKISISSVSNVLAELKNKNLVKCKNPKDKFYRFYEITKKGKMLLRKVR